MVRTTLLVPALLVGLALGAAPRALAAETEVRLFNVSVDGKPSGQYKMTFAKDGGTITITCDAHVKVKVLGVTAYHYDFYGVEEWKDGRLQSLRSRSDDDGKKFDVTAAAGEKGLTVKINGREKTVRGDVYLTTACCLPDAKRRDGDLPLMEPDNGEEINGKIRQVSSSPMTVAGRSINVTRYRLTSGTVHDVWYDSADRMVRQEWTEDGHKTVLELKKP
jgi:YD repeat-containing protein